MLNSVVFVVSGLAMAAHAQHATTTYYINQVPDYSSLSSCAVEPLSTIVRDMSSGCGDGGVYTSFDCFCTSSSSTMDWIIETAVIKKCGTMSANASTASAFAASALQVFSSYCQLPIVAAAQPTTSVAPGHSTLITSATPTASPAAAANTSPPTATSTSATSSGGSSSRLSRSDIAAIAATISSVAAVTIIGLVLFFWLRRRKSQRATKIQPSLITHFVPRGPDMTENSSPDSAMSATRTNSESTYANTHVSTDYGISPVSPAAALAPPALGERRLTPMAELDPQTRFEVDATPARNVRPFQGKWTDVAESTNRYD